MIFLGNQLTIFNHAARRLTSCEPLGSWSEKLRIPILGMRNTSDCGVAMTETIYSSETFARDYAESQASLQQLTEGAVKDLLRRIEDLPSQWRREYPRVKGLERKVLEIDVSGSHRLLVLDADKVILWRVGNHDLIGKVVANRPSYPSSALPLPRQFHLEFRSRLFSAGDHDFTSLEQRCNFVSENSGEWVYELASEQARTGAELVDSVENAVLEGKRRVFAILGGPGTGKTAILIWLLKQFADVEAGGRKLAVRLVMPRQVIRQVECCTGWKLGPFLYEKAPDVVLIDDPASLSGVDQRLYTYGNASVIAGFDPLQMDAAPTDRELDRWRQRNDVHTYWLSECYRQKRVVGEAARDVCDVIAGSSPFLDDFKKSNFREQRAESTSAANKINFVNPGGDFQVIDTHPWKGLADWEREINRLRSSGSLWTHIEPVLLVLDSTIPQASTVRQLIAPLEDKQILDVVTFEESESRKGVDFQHALFVLSRKLYDELTSGFEGKGRKGYEKVRLFRIPFTRPKDSMTVIVLD